MAKGGSFSTAIKKNRLIENFYWYKEKKENIEPYNKKTRGFKIEQFKNDTLIKTWDSINQIKNKKK